MKRQSKLVIGITGGILLIAVVVIIAVLMASSSDSKKYARHMESAQRYMDELQYEQAIAEYKAAIEIEPNNVEAYQALAELYVQTGDYEAAIAVLNQGMEQTGSEELSEYIEEVQAAYEEQKVLEEVALQDKEQESLQESESENGAREERLDLGNGKYTVDEYDENGNLVRKTYYYADGTIDLVFEYDESGNCVRDTSYYSDGTIWIINEYDANGKNTIQYSTTGTILFHNAYEYNENGNLVRDISYLSNGAIWVIKEYDGNRYGEQPRRTIQYDEDGKYWVSECDENGIPIKTTLYNADGTVREVTEY